MTVATHALKYLVLAALLLSVPTAAIAAQKGEGASTVTLILDFPMAFVNNAPSAASSQEMGDHQGHGDHSAHAGHGGGHQHDAPVAKDGASMTTIAHKTFQDRLLVFQDGRVTTIDSLRYSLPAENVRAVTNEVLTYFRRGDALRSEAMAITFASDWKLVGVPNGGKERIVQEGKVSGGVRDFLSGEKPTPEIGNVKHEVNPKTLPPFVFDDIEGKLGLKGQKNTGYRLELRTATEMTAIVAKKGKGSRSQLLTSFTLHVTIKDGKRSQIEIEFPYSRIEAEVKGR
ncbi:MAG: hypothetical protein OEV28_09085 [Nitrospirota bacterium]|nr:hypothetical protein [Nitrospirota bacterium]